MTAFIADACPHHRWLSVLQMSIPVVVVLHVAEGAAATVSGGTGGTALTHTTAFFVPLHSKDTNDTNAINTQVTRKPWHAVLVAPLSPSIPLCPRIRPQTPPPPPRRVAKCIVLLPSAVGTPLFSQRACTWCMPWHPAQRGWVCGEDCGCVLVSGDRTAPGGRVVAVGNQAEFPNSNSNSDSRFEFAPNSPNSV